MKTIFDNVKMLAAVRPVAQAASEATMIVIDTLGYNSAMFVVQNGAATGTPDSYSIACAVKECATSNGSFAAVTGATATITADNKSAQIRVEGLGTSRLRYLEISITPTFVNGTSPKALISASALLGNASTLPVGNSATAA